MRKMHRSECGSWGVARPKSSHPVADLQTTITALGTVNINFAQPHNHVF